MSDKVPTSAVAARREARAREYVDSIIAINRKYGMADTTADDEYAVARRNQRVQISKRSSQLPHRNERRSKPPPVGARLYTLVVTK